MSKKGFQNDKEALSYQPEEATLFLIKNSVFFFFYISVENIIEMFILILLCVWVKRSNKGY